MQKRNIGSSLRRLRWRYSYTSRAHFWNGATLSTSAMFFSRPYASIWTFWPVLTSPVAVGALQNPFWPGTGPSRGWPSGHLGVGAAATLAAGAGGFALSNTRLLLLANTTELPHTCRVPLRAAMPCTL